MQCITNANARGVHKPSANRCTHSASGNVGDFVGGEQTHDLKCRAFQTKKAETKESHSSSSHWRLHGNWNVSPPPPGRIFSSSADPAVKCWLGQWLLKCIIIIIVSLLPLSLCLSFFLSVCHTHSLLHTRTHTAVLPVFCEQIGFCVCGSRTQEQRSPPCWKQKEKPVKSRCPFAHQGHLSRQHAPKHAKVGQRSAGIGLPVQQKVSAAAEDTRAAFPSPLKLSRTKIEQ